MPYNEPDTSPKERWDLCSLLMNLNRDLWLPQALECGRMPLNMWLWSPGHTKDTISISFSSSLGILAFSTQPSRVRKSSPHRGRGPVKIPWLTAAASPQPWASISRCHTVRVDDPSDDSGPQPWSFPVDASDIVGQKPFYTWSEFLTTERVRNNTLYNAQLLCFKAPCFGVTFCSHSKSEILWRGKCVCYWFRKLSVTGGEELKCIVSYR